MLLHLLPMKVYQAILAAVGTIALGTAICGKDEESVLYEHGEILLKLKEPVQYSSDRNLQRGKLGITSLDRLSQKYDIEWAEQVFDTTPDEGLPSIYQLEFPQGTDIEDLV